MYSDAGGVREAAGSNALATAWRSGAPDIRTGHEGLMALHTASIGKVDTVAPGATVEFRWNNPRRTRCCTTPRSPMPPHMPGQHGRRREPFEVTAFGCSTRPERRAHQDACHRAREERGQLADRVRALPDLGGLRPRVRSGSDGRRGQELHHAGGVPATRRTNSHASGRRTGLRSSRPWPGPTVNGDRSENGDYIYGKKRLREIDRRIRYLSKSLDRAVVVDNAGKAHDRVRFGATVTFLHEDTGDEREVTIVGVDELDGGAARVSWKSPLARALLTAKVGDVVTLRAPRGPERLEIIAFCYDDLS